MSETVDHLVAWMRQRVLTADAKGLVVGLSGGVDSAVVARLAQLATPGDAVAVVLPCHSDPQDELALKTERLIRGSDHKRSLPPTPPSTDK